MSVGIQIQDLRHISDRGTGHDAERDEKSSSSSLVTLEIYSLRGCWSVIAAPARVFSRIRST